MPSAFQQKSLHPIKAEGTLAQLVQNGSEAPVLDTIVHPWRKKEEHHASCQADGHAVDSDKEVMHIERKGAPIEEVDRNHVYCKSSRPEGEHGCKSYQTSGKEFLPMAVYP